MLRLHHTVEAAQGGQPVTLDLAALFPAATITNLQPTTLTLQWPATYQRLQWPTATPASLLSPAPTPLEAPGPVAGAVTGGSVITLGPMDIVTYVFGLTAAV